VKTIPVMEAVYARNAEQAGAFNGLLTARHIFCVNVMGSPGAGKTTLLINIIKRLEKSTFVVEGDIASDIDTRLLNAQGIPVVQINTGGACHLDVGQVAEAAASFHDKGFTEGFLFIENIGNLVCPAEFIIGEHIKMLASSVTEGADKPYKYPLAFEKADIVLLNKYDLSPILDFNIEYFMDGVKKLNPDAPVFQVSGKTGQGVGEVVKWLTKQAELVIGS
jgi:hydrogenase nickel incorporation protein HypB